MNPGQEEDRFAGLRAAPRKAVTTLGRGASSDDGDRKTESSLADCCDEGGRVTTSPATPTNAHAVSFEGGARLRPTPRLADAPMRLARDKTRAPGHAAPFDAVARRPQRVKPTLRGDCEGAAEVRTTSPRDPAHPSPPVRVASPHAADFGGASRTVKSLDARCDVVAPRAGMRRVPIVGPGVHCAAARTLILRGDPYAVGMARTDRAVHCGEATEKTAHVGPCAVARAKIVHDVHFAEGRTKANGQRAAQGDVETKEEMLPDPDPGGVRGLMHRLVQTNRGRRS